MAQAVPKAKSSAPKRSFMRRNTEQNISGYLMVMPNLLGFCVFTVFGVLFSLTLAFTDWDMLKGFENANFVGLKNFVDMVGDTYLINSLKNNAILLLTVPITLGLAMILASVFNRGIYGKSGARALYFLPYVTNIVAVSTVWQALYHPSKGPINMILMALGVSKDGLPGWLGSSDWALPAVMIILVWQQLGYDILLYSGALQGVSQDLYEAADLDGAGPIVKFFKITMPQIAPTTFMLTILGIISSLQMWSFMQVITKGGPGTSTYTIGLYIYRSAFVNGRAGYACALSWLLTAIIAVFTVVRSQYEKKYSVE